MIRRAVLEDLPYINELVERAVTVMNKAGNQQWNKEYPLPSHFEKDIDKNELYVSLLDGKLAGTACFSETEHEEYPEIKWSYSDNAITVKRVAVDPEFQRKGIAFELYQYAEKVAREKGIHYLKTDTFAKNLPAQRVFKRSDFECIAERLLPEKQDRIFYFEKKLKDR